jgi:Xaa-Pro aminopeptidase
MRHDPIDPRLFIENRERLRKLLPPNSIAVVNANDIPPANADANLAAVPNSDLFYLTGVEQEETILVLYPDAAEERHRELLFLRPASRENELWEGHKLTRDEARAISGIHEIHWLPDFRRLFHRLMCEADHVFLDSNEHPRAVIDVETREARFVADTLRRYPLHDYRRLAPLIHRLRAVKSDAEVALIRRACQVTGDAFRRVLGFVKPGVNERDVEAEFAHEYVRRGCRFAYLPIIATGPNACCLHYIANSSQCRAGEMLLLDVAAGYANYNSDLTRTIPVSGRFTRRQKRVYNAVLRVLRQSIHGLAPGRIVKDWQNDAERMLEEELLALGLLTARQIKRQDPESPAVKKYFMHGIGHPLGLDVHDVAPGTQHIEAGWVMTVEPGIYIPGEQLGVRLENDVLVTQDKPVDLLASVPIEADEIEDLMNSAAAARKRSAGKE